MKKHSQRAMRVGDQIQKELADLLRNEVKDPRVGRVTVTHVDVSPDLSHANVHFTHLAGREHARRGREGARAHGRLPAHRAVASPRPVLGAAAAFRLRRFDRSGHAAVAADRRSGRGGQEVRRVSILRERSPATPAPHRILTSPFNAARRSPCIDAARRRRAAARQADGLVVERGAAAREAALSRREGRAHGHARSARVGIAAAVLRRSDQVRAASCSTPPKRYTATFRFGATTATGDAEGEVRRRGPVTFTRDDARSGAAAFRGSDRAGAARLLGAQVRGPRLLRVRARRALTSRASRARSRSTRCACSTGTRRTPSSTSSAARGRTSACSPRTSARRSAAARTWRRCGGRRPAASTRGRPAARAPGGMTDAERLRALAPVSSLVAEPARASASARSRPQRFRQGQALAGAGAPGRRLRGVRRRPVPGHCDGRRRRGAAAPGRGRAGARRSGNLLIAKRISAYNY